MTQTAPQFGRGLLRQFLLVVLCSLLSNTVLDSGWSHQVVKLLGQVFYTTLSLGLLYGFVRLLGAKVTEVDWFYDQFPFGFLKAAFSERSVAISAEEVTTSATEPSQDMTASKDSEIDWERLLSPDLLRWLGIVLILSAVVSLLFKVEWSLSLKLIASVVSGASLLAAAVWWHQRNNQTAYALSSLAGFSLLQFSLTLGCRYVQLEGTSSLLANPDSWLAAKLIFTSLCVLFLFDFRLVYHAAAIFVVAFASPFWMKMEGFTVSPQALATFIIAMQLLFLSVWSKVRLHQFWYIGIVGSYALVADMAQASSIFSFPVLSLPERIATLLLGVSVICYLVQFLWAGFLYRKEPSFRPSLVLTAIATQILFLSELYLFATNIELFKNSLGLLIVASTLAPFVMAIVAGKSEGGRRDSETLMNLTILVSSLGLFMEANDMWAALLFLSFACLITWYALRSPLARTKVYAVVALGLSVFKLYVEAQDVFKSVPGNLVVIILGTILLVLAQKFHTGKKNSNDAQQEQ